MTFRSSARKKGGVDLSAFHATQGRRIVTFNIRFVRLRVLHRGGRAVKKFTQFSLSSSCHQTTLLLAIKGNSAYQSAIFKTFKEIVCRFDLVRRWWRSSSAR